MASMGIAMALAAAGALALAVAGLAYEKYRLRGWEAARPRPQGLGAELERYRLEGGKSLVRYENGCSKTHPSGFVEWARWSYVDDVEVRQLVLDVPSDCQHGVFLELRDGTRIFLAGPSECLSGFAEAACAAVFAEHLSRYQVQLIAGEPVPVHGVRSLYLTPDGLKRGRRAVPWSRIERIEEDADNCVRFHTADGPVSWATFRNDRPRGRACLEVAREMQGRRRTADA